LHHFHLLRHTAAKLLRVRRRRPLRGHPNGACLVPDAPNTPAALNMPFSPSSFFRNNFMSLSRRQTICSLLAIGLAGVCMPTLAAAPLAPHVLLKTSAGEIVLELNPQKAPVTVDNFVQYVKSGQYNATIFHRVIDGFMIQGGGMTADLSEKPTRAPIVNEASNGLKNTRYSVAMARTANPDSATAQFFINVADNASLDYPGRDGAGYTVFGKVIKGMDVVDKIRGVATGDRGGNQNVPIKPITIVSATVVP
jgi:cyclophilin family peptidyl-prolyl cis-trans isomerase